MSSVDFADFVDFGVVAALDKLHTKHVLPGFTDRSSEEREIERQTIDITRVSHKNYVLFPILIDTKCRISNAVHL